MFMVVPLKDICELYNRFYRMNLDSKITLNWTLEEIDFKNFLMLLSPVQSRETTEANCWT